MQKHIDRLMLEYFITELVETYPTIGMNAVSEGINSHPKFKARKISITTSGVRKVFVRNGLNDPPRKGGREAHSNTEVVRKFNPTPLTIQIWE